MSFEEQQILPPDDIPPPLPPTDAPEPPKFSSIPETMKAMVYNQFGEDPKQILQVVYDHPIPRLTKWEVLVKVMATSVNPVDWKIMRGNFNIVINKFPITPCFDVSGVVVAIGERVRRIRVGDCVYGMTKGYGDRTCGGCAEYVAISERCVAKMPQTLTFLEAASFPLIALTTLQGIGKYAKDGMRILVLAASGGVGSFAVQYAKAKGCYVAATCGTRNVQLVKDLGVDRVIDYTKELWSEVLLGQDFDVIFDCVGGVENWVQGQQVLKKKGYFVTIAGDHQDQMTVGRMLNIGGNWLGRNIMSMFNHPQYSYYVTESTRGHLQLIETRQLIDGGFIKPIIEKDSIFRMDNIGDAFVKSIGGRTTGKIVIRVDEENCDKKSSDFGVKGIIQKEEPLLDDVSE